MKKNKLVSAPNSKNILGGKGVGREGQGAWVFLRVSLVFLIKPQLTWRCI